MATEFELKFAAAPEQLDQIRAVFPGHYLPISMETTYYDTPDHSLSARKWTLRRRLENGVSICTLKTPGDGFGRHEWETEQDSIRDAIPVLCKLSGLEMLDELTREGVISVCGARFTRLACPMEADGATVELALDRGILFGGGRELSFAEVEVELKTGSEEAACRFAQALARQFGLHPEEKSKFRRALSLAQGE